MERPHIVIEHTINTHPNAQKPRTKKDKETGKTYEAHPGLTTRTKKRYLTDGIVGPMGPLGSPYVWATAEWITTKVGNGNYTPVGVGGFENIKSLPMDWQKQLNDVRRAVEPFIRANKRIAELEAQVNEPTKTKPRKSTKSTTADDQTRDGALQAEG